MKKSEAQKIAYRIVYRLLDLELRRSNGYVDYFSEIQTSDDKDMVLLELSEIRVQSYNKAYPE
jgi:hypothetical protein